MKRLLLILVVVIVSMTLGFAQKNVRQTASNFLKEGKLDKALENINQCIQDPSTATDAKAWFIRGNIYLEIANTKEEAYKALDPDPLQKALESYKKATEYDTKKDYAEDIYAKVNWQRNNYFNQAVDNYNKKQYVDAMQAFENSAQALASINVPDTISLFYAAACAALAENDKNNTRLSEAELNAKQKGYYTELIKLDSKSTTVYTSLSDIYRLEKDSANALKVLRDAQKKFPNDFKIFLAETNIYLTFNNTTKALNNLKTATQKDSTNPTVFFALGTIYDNLSNDTNRTEKERKECFDLAIKSYRGAIRLNPAYFEPNYNIGAMFVNKAATINDQANKLPLDADAEFKKLKAEADNYLEEAVPYLEKASEVQPNDLNTLVSLKQIYSRTNKTDKLKIVNEKIATLKK
jgi:hypothetical protein